MLTVRPTTQQELDERGMFRSAESLLSAVNPAGGVIGLIDADSLEIQWVSQAGDRNAVLRAVEDYRLTNDPRRAGGRGVGP